MKITEWVVYLLIVYCLYRTLKAYQYQQRKTALLYEILLERTSILFRDMYNKDNPGGHEIAMKIVIQIEREALKTKMHSREDFKKLTISEINTLFDDVYGKEDSETIRLKNDIYNKK